DLSDDVHAFGHMSEGGKAVGVAAGASGVEAWHVGYKDEEVGPGGAGTVIGHRDRPREIVKTSLGGRLVRNRRIEQARVAPDPSLNQAAVLSVGVGHMHRSVEDLTIEAVSVDVMEEIGGGYRSVPAVERDHDPAEVRVNRDRDEVFLRRRSLSGGSGRRSLRKGGSGECGNRIGGKDSEHHRRAHSKAGMNIATGWVLGAF